MTFNVAEKVQAAVAPFNQAFEANVNTVKVLAGQQTALYTNLLDEAVVFSKAAAAQTSVSGLVAAQKEYAQTVKTTVVASGKDTVATVKGVKEAAVAQAKDTFASVKAAAAKVAGK